MRFNYLLSLSGLGVFTAARALPLNGSTGEADDYTVQAAGVYNPDNIASDDLWKKYLDKGAHYQCLFKANDEAAGRLVEDTRIPPSAQSVWKGSMYAERFTWNWHENGFDEDNCNFEYLHLKDAFDALKLNAYCEDDGGHNIGWSLGHYDESKTTGSEPNHYFNMIPPVDQTYTVDGKTYKSTGGYYVFVVNQVDGVIVALDINSPRNAVKEHWASIGGKAKPDELPKLQYGSDLFWGKWVEDNADVKKLRVYAVHNVLNDETSALVSRAMRNKNSAKLAVWPGTAFDAQTDTAEFQALLGSPIGGTIAIMLAQHKAELGNKEIYQINVVSDISSLKSFQTTEMHMFFHIRDVKSNPVDEGGKDMGLEKLNARRWWEKL